MCQTRGATRTLLGKSHSYVESKLLDLVHLRPVDSVDVTIVVDNSIDILLPSKGPVMRPSLAWNWSERQQLVAEHGYSVLLTFHRKGETKSILYDAGLTPQAAMHNLDVLGIQLKDLDSIVLSHGHADHHGGLEGIIRKIGRRNLPLVLHPDAWRNRKIAFPSGVEIHMPPPNRRALEGEDVQLIEERGPSFLLGDTALVTGQVERVTDFEKGLPTQYAEEGGAWTPDPWTWDDQGVVCNVNGKGLIVVSSCSHSGVINVLRNAQKLIGVERVHGFVGGLHLSGGLFEPIIPQTIRELVAVRPDMIVPGHCTGWKATHEIARKLPEAFVQTSVGTHIHFG